MASLEEWDVDVSYILTWLETLSVRDYERVLAALAVVRGRGPSVGRPLVDRVHGSKLHHLKELRAVTTQRRAIRILFAFDPERRAICLVGGDKSGAWGHWYRENIPRAEELYDRHIKNSSHGAGHSSGPSG